MWHCLSISLSTNFDHSLSHENMNVSRRINVSCSYEWGFIIWNRYSFETMTVIITTSSQSIASSTQSGENREGDSFNNPTGLNPTFVSTYPVIWWKRQSQLRST
jgi:hypothetical protein